MLTRELIQLLGGRFVAQYQNGAGFPKTLPEKCTNIVFTNQDGANMATIKLIHQVAPEIATTIKVPALKDYSGNFKEFVAVDVSVSTTFIIEVRA